MKRVWHLFTVLLLFFLVSCSGENAAAPTTATTATDSSSDDSETAAPPRPTGWSEASHGNDTDPNYDVVFPEDKVNQITITIDPASYAAMQADMTELLGEPGTRSGPGGFGRPPGQGQPPTDGQFPPEGGQPRADGQFTPGNGQPPEGFVPGQGGPGGFGGGDFTVENPMWVTATLSFEGQTWTNVGIRYKGNSSLMTAWNDSSEKLPFKLDFDQFESEYPEIENQRFYGFKQLSLANGFGDATFMRETMAYDLLAEAGLTAAATAFYEVTLDYGAGPVNLGLYLMIEVVDDTVVDRVFGDDNGNIYEGDGAAASLAEGTFDQISDSFQKENNEDEADWSDIEELYNVLHATNRTSDAAAWRASLESVFAVDSFLEWLALSTIIQHWDAYGAMSHNYYLYHDPDTDQLTWISWDHNLILGANPGGPNGGNGNNTPAAGPDGGGGPGNRSTTFDKVDVNNSWPLIRFLLDDPVYFARYMDFLAEASELFDADELSAQYQVWTELLAPYVEDQTAFVTAVEQLTTITYERDAAAAAFLSNQ